MIDVAKTLESDGMQKAAIGRSFFEQGGRTFARALCRAALLSALSWGSLTGFAENAAAATKDDPFGEISGGSRVRNEDFLIVQRHPERWDASTPAGPILAEGMRLSAVFDLLCLEERSTSAKGWGVARALVPKEMIDGAAKRIGRRSRLYSTAFTLPSALSLDQLRRLAAGDPCVVRVSPDAEYEVAGGIEKLDPYVEQQDHLAYIAGSRALRRLEPLLRRTQPSVIAIIDTGVDLNHPDLAPNSWKNRLETPANGIDDDGNGYTDDINGYNFALRRGRSGPESDLNYFRHGTHVAGLAAARFGNGLGGSGVNGLAKIMSLNVFGDKRTSRVSYLENAIRYAVDNGARVINLSIGGREYTTSMEETLRYAILRGAVIVAASGNNGIELSGDPASVRYMTPAAFGRALQGMVAVTSIDTRTGALSAFANYSMLLTELAAPGALRSGSIEDGLLSTFPKGQYGRLAGTSMAAPVVSGAVALIQAWLSVSGQAASPAIIERILIEGSRQSDRIIGMTFHGRVLDLDKLIGYLDRFYPLPTAVFAN